MSSLLAHFDALCELDDFAREAKLSAIAENDPTLAAQLRAMLKADRDTGGPIAREIDAQPAAAASFTASKRTRPDFGAYHLLRELGAGGMGVVWLAERSLGASTQLVAIKFMRHDGSAELLKHFARERDALARLEHPNIARLIDAGVSDDGEPYLATEYVDGEPLLTFVRQNQLDLNERLQLLESLCDAVDYAHRRLLVHRDIKPSNVMVDRTGRVRLLDFGIAKVLDEGNTEASQNNPLSPAYAAPEQALGEAISTATDVFGLGLLLFELLTGALPAQRRGISASEMVRRIGAETIEAPSAALTQPAPLAQDALTTRPQWTQQLRGDLDLIVLKALKREPERRYASALALAQDLRNFREGRPVQARPDSRGYRARRFLRRNRLWVGSIAAVFLALVIGLGAALWQTKVAREQRMRAENEAATGRRIVDFAMSMVQQVNAHTRRSTAPAAPGEMLVSSIANARATLKDDPSALAPVLSRLGSILAVSGDLTVAQKAIEDALDIYHRTLAPNDPIVAGSQLALASVYMQQGKHDAVEALLLPAFETFSGAKSFDQYAAMTQSHLARNARSMGQLPLALARLERAQSLFAGAYGPDHPSTIELDGNRAILLFEMARYQESEAAYRRAIANYERVGGRDFPRLFGPLSGLARLLAMRGDYPSAKEAYARGIAIGRDKIGAADPFVVASQIGLVQLLCALGETDQAQALLDSLDLSQVTDRQRIQQDLAFARAALARGKSDWDTEQAQLQMALDFAQRSDNKDSASALGALAQLAQNALRRGDRASAIRLEAEASAMLTRMPPTPLIDRLVLIDVRAELMAPDKRSEAITSVQSALTELIALTGPNTVEVATLQSRLAALENPSKTPP